MKIQLRIFLSTLLLVSVIVYLFIDFIKNEIAIRYVETVEETLNDTANLTAAIIEISLTEKTIDTNNLKAIITNAKMRTISARIRKMEKTKTDIDVIVVDMNGVVLYDSRGIDTGKDYSRWNDIFLSLKGKYGARSSTNQRNPSGALYIAAPIYFKGTIIGAVSIEKPKTSINHLVQLTESRISQLSLLAFALIIFLMLLTTFWITRPINKLRHFVRSSLTNRATLLPNLGNSEIAELGKSFSELIEELEGKKYIEHYVQTLTHELKSPISSLRAASELLQENPPKEIRQKFYKNIENESKRMETIVERLLTLSSLENRSALKQPEEIKLYELIQEVLISLTPTCKKKKLLITNQIAAEITLFGERFLIRHIIVNLLENSIKYSLPAQNIHITANKQEKNIFVSIRDQGEGIPTYALERIFDKFYSLPPRKGAGKGSGLGLAFVKEALILHDATIDIVNNNDRGITATICFNL